MNDPGTRPRSVLLVALFGIAGLVVAVDQVTKQLAIHYLEDRPPIPVIGDLAGFAFYRNPGAAFGMGAGSTWVFALIAMVVLVGILFAGRKLGSRGWALGLGLLLGGLTGNLLDRLFRAPGAFHGAVVDFIDLYFFICNVADIAISAAAVVVVVLTFRGIGLDGRREGEDPAPGTDEQDPGPQAPAERETA